MRNTRKRVVPALLQVVFSALVVEDTC